MKAPDTSVVVPLLASWHERHGDVTEALSGQPKVLIAHVAMETYSVLTRLPHGLAIPARNATALLRAHFPDPVLGLGDDDHDKLLDKMASEGIVGGAVYDALVAATAMAAGLRLTTLDRRALGVYRQIGVELDLLA